MKNCFVFGFLFFFVKELGSGRAIHLEVDGDTLLTVAHSSGLKPPWCSSVTHCRCCSNTSCVIKRENEGVEREGI